MNKDKKKEFGKMEIKKIRKWKMENGIQKAFGRNWEIKALCLLIFNPESTPISR